MARIGPRATAFEAFKTLRNRLRLLHVHDVVARCLQILNHPDVNTFERVRNYRPWEMLLLYKWALVHCEQNRRLSRHVRGSDEFNYLVGLAGEVANCARPPSEYGVAYLFLRSVAYQQFWLQDNLSGAGLARQSYIFGRLAFNHKFRKNFRDRLGLDIPDFIMLSMMLAPRIFVRDRLSFTREWFDPVSGAIGSGTINAFLEAISLDMESARAYALSKASRDVELELYERTPFQNKPLLRVKNVKGEWEYVPIAKAILSRALSLFIYRFLRDMDSARFMNEFGVLFEAYVHRLLEFSGCHFLDESRLMKLCPGSKVVDALIRDGNDNIFLDAKGVEFPEIGMITHLANIVRDRAKPSILKAISQASEFISSAYSSGVDCLGAGCNYLIVVTMQDTFVGNGVDFFNMIGMGELEKIYERNRDSARIPAEHMYFMSVQDFELLVACVKQGGVTFSSALKMAVADDSVPETKKFVFSQHILSSYGLPNLIEFLSSEIDCVLARCEAAFAQGGG